jgi:hypothetical protein
MVRKDPFGFSPKIGLRGFPKVRQGRLDSSLLFPHFVVCKRRKERTSTINKETMHTNNKQSINNEWVNARQTIPLWNARGGWALAVFFRCFSARPFPNEIAPLHFSCVRLNRIVPSHLYVKPSSYRHLFAIPCYARHGSTKTSSRRIVIEVQTNLLSIDEHWKKCNAEKIPKMRCEYIFFKQTIWTRNRDIGRLVPRRKTKIALRAGNANNKNIPSMHK